MRVLQVVTHMNRGGLETMLMNYYRHIDKNKIQFDFLTHRPESETKDYDDEIRALGGRIYHMPPLNPFNPHYFKMLDQFFEEHSEYKIVHAHLDCMSGYPLRIAKKHGVPVRIAHAHTTLIDKNIKKYIKLFSKKRISSVATILFACGKEAGSWMFAGDKFQILNNAIDVREYVFDVNKRLKVRNEFGLEDDEFIIGHVGNFTEAKNHEFILNLIEEVSKETTKIKFVLVGDGERRTQYQRIAHELKIDDKVIFTGKRQDVSSLMQGFDLFIFPSIYEGLPVTLVEAQASGLPCLVSQNVTREISITENIRFLSLEYIEEWKQEIVKLSRERFPRKNMGKMIIEKNFDIKNNAKWLEEFYIETAGN